MKEMMTIKVPPTPPLAIVSAPAPPPLPATTTMDGTAAAVVAMVAIAGRLPSSDTPVFYVKFDTTKVRRARMKNVQMINYCSFTVLW